MGSEIDVGDNELTLDQVAEDFLARLREGERPAIQEYVSKYPDLANDIEELFPTLASLENYDVGPASAAPGIEFNAPQKLGDYRILREVGRGGMGVVYEALHETMQRRVALKVLPNAGNRKNNTKRFLREARAAGQLHHTNIVPVFEVGEADGIHYYAMQFIHGQNLDVVLEELRRLEAMSTATFRSSRHSSPASEVAVASANQQVRAPSVSESTTQLWSGVSRENAKQKYDKQNSIDALTPSEHMDGGQSGEALLGDESQRVADVRQSESDASSQWTQQGNTSAKYFKRVAKGAQQVADALEYAHCHGVLHRDVKPSNLLLDTAGLLWVSDFGLAKDDSEDLTHTGDIIGTLRYMAPERFSGDADVRCDIYSLGLTLYEMCTMRYAFDESDRAQLMHQIASRDPVPPRRFRPEIPLDLETIILKAVARDPAARYQTARHFADDLGRFIDDKPVMARRISPVEVIWRWCRRNPSYALLFGCINLIAGLFVLGAAGFVLQSMRHASELRNETYRAIGAEREARQAKLEATRSLYRSYVGFANASRWSRQRGQRFESLDQLREAAKLLPSLAWPPAEIAKEQLLLRNSAIAAMPLVDIREISSWPTRTFARAALSKNGQLIAWSEEDGLLVVRSVDDEKVIGEFQGPPEQAWIVEFDASGRYVAAKFHDDVPLTPPKILVWEIATGEKLLDIRKELGRGCFAFHPARDEFFVCRKSGELDIYSIIQRKLLRTVSTGTDVSSIVFDPAGNPCWERGKQIRRFVVQSGEAETIDLPAAIHSFTWKRNGDLIVGARNGQIYVRDGQSETIRNFGKHTGNVARILLSPNEDLLVADAWGGSRVIHDIRTGDALLSLEGLHTDSIAKTQNRLALSRSFNSHGVWEFATGAPLREISTLPGQLHWDVVPHPRVESLVALTVKQGVEFWDIDREKRLAKIDGTEVTQMAFSPEGDRLYTVSVANSPPAVYEVSIFEQPNGNYEVATSEGAPIAGLPVSRPAGRTNHLAIDALGESLVAIDGLSSVKIARLHGASEPVVLQRHHMVSRVAMSPDGTKVVTGTWKGEGIRLWNAKTGKLIKDLAPEAGSTWPAFSPDGRWLMAATKEADYLWDTNDWTLRTIDRGDQTGFEGRIAFSPDSRLAVIWKSQFVPRLVDPTTAAEIAVLDAPNRKTGVPAFTNSGSKLVIAGTGCMQVWDFSQLRSELSELGLDWSLTGSQ